MNRRVVLLLLAAVALGTLFWNVAPQSEVARAQTGAETANRRSAQTENRRNSLHSQSDRPFDARIAAGAARFDRTPGAADWIVVRSPDVERQAQRLIAQVDYAALYREISARPGVLSADELVVLRLALLRCYAIRYADSAFQFIPAAIARQVADAVPATPRAQAAKRLFAACEGIPADAHGSENLSRLHDAIAREHALQHVVEVDWRIMAQTGRARQAVAQFGEALAGRDVLLMPAMSTFLETQLSAAGLAGEFTDRGLPVDQIEKAWQLVACEMVGGCGPQSFPLLANCVQANRCDAASLREYYERYEPQAYAGIRAWHERLTASYRTGDWSWLDLNRLQSRLPGG